MSLGINTNIQKMKRGLQALLGLVLINVVFMILAPSYRQIENFTTMLSNATVLGCRAAGATIVLISGGLDLSIGSVMAVVSVVVGSLLNLNVPPYVAAAAGLRVGAVCGLFSGSIIVFTGIPSFIGTL